jgi:hypothetical protein
MMRAIIIVMGSIILAGCQANAPALDSGHLDLRENSLYSYDECVSMTQIMGLGHPYRINSAIGIAARNHARMTNKSNEDMLRQYCFGQFYHPDEYCVIIINKNPDIDDSSARCFRSSTVLFSK